MNLSNANYLEMSDAEFKDFIDEMTDARNRSLGRANRNRRYRFRNYSCNDRQWYVAGKYVNEYGAVIGGILEWCNDRDDAVAMLGHMAKYEEFRDLYIDEMDI